MFFNEGATGVELLTYQTAADCSYIELYSHVSLNIVYVLLENTK